MCRNSLFANDTFLGSGDETKNNYEFMMGWKIYVNGAGAHGDISQDSEHGTTGYSDVVIDADTNHNGKIGIYTTVTKLGQKAYRPYIHVVFDVGTFTKAGSDCSMWVELDDGSGGALTTQEITASGIQEVSMRSRAGAGDFTVKFYITGDGTLAGAPRMRICGCMVLVSNKTFTVDTATIPFSPSAWEVNMDSVIAHIAVPADPTGGTVQDAEARATINSINDALDYITLALETLMFTKKV
jgi:hypothetical protein